MVRQILGAVSQFERAMVVERLRQARHRTGKLGGLPRVPDETKKLARRLHRKRSLRSVANELARRGHVTSQGSPYSPTAIKRMLS
jgi:DNA invertase Pin-like site-specific DNA recombinase